MPEKIDLSDLPNIVEGALLPLDTAALKAADDPGHAPSRATYEQAGFVRSPVARYFRSL